MATLGQAIKVATALLRKSPTAVPMFRSRPGEGKSEAAIQIGKEGLGLPDDRILVVHVNNHEVVDFTGLPSVRDGQTTFNPTEMFYKFRKGTGAGLIVLEELPQSTTHHQTWAAGFVLERKTPTFELDPQVRFIITGNRAEDKAGAKPLLTHLANRLYQIDIETSINDWSAWALDNGVPTNGIAFLRLRPEILNDFDPNRQINPTQRAWTQLFRDVPDDLPADLYNIAAAAKVGDGPAAEWVSARDMMAKMPSVDAIRMHPDTAEVPHDPSIRFAITTAMSATGTPDSLDRDMKFIERMPPEFSMVYLSDMVRRHGVGAIQQTHTFIKWSTNPKTQDIFLGRN
jgi:hypothetical protein